MKPILRIIPLCLLATGGTAFAKTPPSTDSQAQTLRSRPNRPSPGLDWIETERNLNREQRVELWLQLFDHNQNGKLDPEEIEEIARYRHAHREREAAAQRRQIVQEAMRLREETEQNAPSEKSLENVHTEAQIESGE